MGGSRLKSIVCSNIRKQRQLKGINQNQLADLVGATQACISNIESTKRGPSLELIEKIAKALEINPASLFMPAAE